VNRRLIALLLVASIESNPPSELISSVSATDSLTRC